MELTTKQLSGEHDDFYDLARGYTEMSELNREITQEFAACEEEAERHLDKIWN